MGYIHVAKRKVAQESGVPFGGRTWAEISPPKVAYIRRICTCTNPIPARTTAAVHTYRCLCSCSAKRQPSSVGKTLFPPLAQVCSVYLSAIYTEQTVKEDTTAVVSPVLKQGKQCTWYGQARTASSRLFTGKFILRAAIQWPVALCTPGSVRRWITP